MSEQLLHQAIRLAKAGQKEQALQMLQQILLDDPFNELGWLWLADCLPTLRGRIAALETFVNANPDAQRARAGLEALRRQEAEEQSAPPQPQPAPAQASYAGEWVVEHPAPAETAGETQAQPPAAEADAAPTDFSALFAADEQAEQPYEETDATPAELAALFAADEQAEPPAAEADAAPIDFSALFAADEQAAAPFPFLPDEQDSPDQPVEEADAAFTDFSFLFEEETAAKQPVAPFLPDDDEPHAAQSAAVPPSPFLIEAEPPPGQPQAGEEAPAVFTTPFEEVSPAEFEHIQQRSQAALENSPPIRPLKHQGRPAAAPPAREPARKQNALAILVIVLFIIGLLGLLVVLAAILLTGGFF